MAYNKNTPYNDLPDLPPKSFEISPEIYRTLISASRHLAELNGLCSSIPEPQLLINTIVLQESKDSSAIENIVTTQDELYKATTEISEASQSAKEVLSYREALYSGLESMQKHHNLLLTKTMVEIVKTIKNNDAGIRNTPGTALKNAVSGEVIYTPPCCEDEIIRKLSALEKFINDDKLSDLDPLIKMALIHYQFESIHPFSDGNGRTGRILNALYLVQKGLLNMPVLYLSSFIIKNKALYYQLLRQVTENDNWNDWVLYILNGLVETSQTTIEKIKKMLQLKDETEIKMKEVLGASYNHDLLQLMFTLPYLKIELLEKGNLAHRQTASTWLKKLSEAGILSPQKIGRTNYFVNENLIKIFSE